MTKLLGVVNWRTTLTGLLESATAMLTLLAALPYELGEVATILPPEYKARIVTVGIVATFLLRVINRAVAKDIQVAGNGTVDQPNRVNVGIAHSERAETFRNPDDAGSGGVGLTLLIVALGIAAFFLVGCETVTDEDGNTTSRVDWSGVATGISTGLDSYERYDRIQHPERYPVVYPAPVYPVPAQPVYVP